MGIKKGTKLTDTPKDYMIKVRLDKKTLDELDDVCKRNNANRSQVIRKGIELQYQKTE